MYSRCEKDIYRNAKKEKRVHTKSVHEFIIQIRPTAMLVAMLRPYHVRAELRFELNGNVNMLPITQLTSCVLAHLISTITVLIAD